ncbi:MBOAT family protein [Candidatus Pseudothioglobus singularis]|nr:MBOAT family protein [Candidatus Pseudothioglobus singularis]
MLFNSYEFLFLFLPIVLVGFHLIGKKGHQRFAIAWLVGASLFFYGWWNPAYLGLMIFSILFNYSIGISLIKTYGYKLSNKAILIIGVVTNLAVLGYFKYANFFVDNLNIYTGTNLILHQVILPLAISFFTFQQIAYLVDTFKGKTKEYNFLHYCLFVTFFPQLIAGPIVHHKEMLPQFAKDSVYKILSKNLAIGLTIFTLGLFKKVVLADGMSDFSMPVFNAAELGITLTFFEAWCGAISYTLQLYFDFSGYSDMAIGIARMFGIRLPINFNSPYKATSIIDFWRRWHMTLSRFLKEYVYISLGGNRKGEVRRHINIIITMLLGGLWHGAGWTFVLWGLLHGFYLVINHIWRGLFKNRVGSKLKIFISWSITFLAVVFSWVLFRAESLDSARNIYLSMLGVNGISLPTKFKSILDYSWMGQYNVDFTGIIGNGIIKDHRALAVWITLSLILILVFPNIQQFIYQQNYKLHNLKFIVIRWSPSLFWIGFTSIILIVSIICISGDSEFIYFNF